jgi:hypothetical protein
VASASPSSRNFRAGFGCCPTSSPHPGVSFKRILCAWSSGKGLSPHSCGRKP